ncbi:MAG: sigma-70 family RNA polymerase sigma factor [Verrucomicrobia bacterium]|nr:sigma-70 family RNA polymerase sigma factor [Verrucomicrobiota bacterium]
MPWEPNEGAVHWTDLVSETPLDRRSVARVGSAVAPTDASIGALTRRLARGEEEAYREFHRDYFDRLYRLLLVLCRGQETEAREALQDTLCRVARHVRRFDDPEIFWCWLGVLARSAARDAGRKRRRYWRLLVDYAQRWLPVERSPADDHDQQLEALLLECLAELDPTDRRLVEGKYFSRRSIGELARDTGLTERAMESRLFRVRGQLRECLLFKLRKDPL